MVVEIEETIRKGQKGKGVDIRALKTALNKLHFYTPPKNKGITDEADNALFDAIEAFQERFFIPREIMITPDSLTIRRLNEELDNPVHFQIFNSRYVWKTVGDKHVRGSHAAREGRIFEWSNEPEGGHPGEDYNCRCWAEPMMPTAPRGLNASMSDLINDVPLDGINPTWSPLDVLGGAGVVLGRSIVSAVVSKKLKKLTKSEIKSINSYKKQIKKHQDKLKLYKKNPDKYDNKNYLKNAPNKKIRKNVIDSRIKHLDEEINYFKAEIKRISNKKDKK